MRKINFILIQKLFNSENDFGTESKLICLEGRKYTSIGAQRGARVDVLASKN